MSNKNIQGNSPKKTFEEFIQSRSLEQIEDDANKFLSGTPPDDYLYDKKSLKEKYALLNEWLRFIQSDSSLARLKWTHFSKKAKIPKLRNRDRYVYEFLQVLSKNRQGKSSSFKSFVEDHWVPWSYYQDHFFFWFLNRYHIRNARRIFYISSGLKTFFLTNLHIVLFFLVLISTGVFLIIRKSLYLISSVLLAAPIIFAAISGLVLCFRKKSYNFKFVYYIHSFIPRLGATISVGYLFLLSVPHFVAIIYSNRIPATYQGAGGILLLFIAVVFIMLNIQKRVHPALNSADLGFRAFDMLVIALTYAIYELALFEKLLFLFVKEESGLPPAAPCFPQLFFITSFALFIGLVLQLIWEEKPFTEPL